MSRLLDEILSDDNILKAQKHVCAKNGAEGIDGVKAKELSAYMEEKWPSIKKQIQERKYKPLPVRRKEIPKPSGGVRKLGIPTVVDRTIQQAITQVLVPIYEPLFSDHSYGFRPGRRCEQAIIQLLEYFNDGYTWIVDIDLEKFFDNVPQDKLMSLIHTVINDGDTESLIRKFLQAGVMVEGQYEETSLGTPQGGNLSPLLSNIMLNELDKELEARNLRFTRYADDCVIVVGSKAAATRVMYSITDWIERKLGLKVNATKTHTTTPWELKYLGFGFWKDQNTNEWKTRPHQESVQRLKRKIKQICERNRSISMDVRLDEINPVIRGWINNFALGDMKNQMQKIEGHLYTQMRVIIWKQWKVPAKREYSLIKLGIEKWQAHALSYCKEYYPTVYLPQIKKAISKKRLMGRGLISPLDYYLQRHALKLS